MKGRVKMSKPVVAFVGRPNVGKSTLFNKLSGKRVSIVDDMPGVTRDRVYSECEWRGRKISLIDTGGIEISGAEDIISKAIKSQAEIAMDVADVIVFVVDGKVGMALGDEEIANVLKRSGKPVIVCVNKLDKVGNENYNLYEFYNLGLGEPIAVSSVHGHGTGDLLDEVFKYFPESNASDDESYISVAVIGKPNVGKSSLINRISGSERSIVSDIAGTTRDTIDSTVINNHGKYNFIDTAGIRRRSKVSEKVEKYSVIRAGMAIERSDVCVIMIDAKEGATEQDTKVAGLAHEAGKACIIAVNKWDAIAKETKTLENYKRKIKEKFNFMSYAPVLFISAKTGQRIEDLFELINKVSEYNSMRVSTGVLNEVLSRAVVKTPPPSHKGKKLKIYYMTQVSVKPPTFVFFVNKAELFHFSYQHYIENNLRETFGFVGTPIHFVIREKGENSFEPKI